MKAKGMQQKHKFNDLADDIRKGTTRIRYPKRAAKQKQDSFQQTDIEKQHVLRRMELQRQQDVSQEPWTTGGPTPNPYTASAMPYEFKPAEFATLEGTQMQWENETHNTNYVCNVEANSALDLHIEARIQKERSELQSRELKQ